MNIRLAKTDDAAAISAMMYALAEKYVVPDFPVSAANALLVSMLPEGVRKHLRGGCRYHVAESDGQIVGVIGIKDNKHLYHLFVSEAHQRKGVARNLWQTAITVCRASGYQGEFTVNSSVHTQMMYEKLGFVAQPPSRVRDGVTTIPMVLTPTR